DDPARSRGGPGLPAGREPGSRLLHRRAMIPSDAPRTAILREAMAPDRGGSPRIHALVLAGGSGDRFGAEMPKQFVRLAGEPILLRSIRAIAGAGIDQVVVVTHPSWLEETRTLLADADLGIEPRIVAGGATRNESTRNGLAALTDAADDDIVVIHDAVRPLVPQEVILRSIEPIMSGRADATDTVIPSADTLVVVEGDAVAEIPERARYRRGQTPQTFRKSVIDAAYRAASAVGDLGATDDCSLVLRH